MAERESSFLGEGVKLAICILASQAAGLVGTIFTMQSIPTWYDTLAKPAFTPPGWVFSIVWIALYSLMGIAAYLVLRMGLHRPSVRIAMAGFIIQLGLNALWTYLFFGRRDPVAGLLEIAILWVAILFTLVRFKPLSSVAAGLMAPYLLWVSFAVALNAAIVWMNR